MTDPATGLDAASAPLAVDGGGASGAFAEPTRRVGAGWIAAFASAWFGIWMAQLTPVQLLLPAQIDARLHPDDWIESVVAFGVISGIAAVFVIAGNIPGGWDELRKYAAEHHKLQMFDFQPSWSSPYNLWAGLIGGAVLTIGTHGTDHMMVQRYLSARSQRDAGRAVFVSGLVVFAQFAVFLFIGVELACFYAGYSDLNFEKTADQASNSAPRTRVDLQLATPEKTNAPTESSDVAEDVS